MKQGVTKDVGSLDILRIAGIMGKNQRIMLGDERRCIDVSPDAMLPVGMKTGAAVDGGLVFEETAVAKRD